MQILTRFLFDDVYHIGFILLTTSSTFNPNGKLPGTWTKLNEGYVLKTINTGTAGSYSNAGNTGDCTLNTTQIPSHRHSYTHIKTGSAGNGSGNAFNPQMTQAGSTSSYTDYTGGGKAHNHTAGMPANIGVYAWQRTA